MSDLRVGLIGAGWIAESHVLHIDAAPGARLVAACDLDLARAEAVAVGRNARAYADWVQMVEREQLDAVWICTPPMHHRAPAVAALELGINVYLEKPIARDLSDGEAIVAAARRSDAVCAVGYQWRGSELLPRVREAVAPNAIGMLVSRNYGPVVGRGWFIDRQQSGGQILERASHHIDLQRAIAGDVVAVRAAGGETEIAQAARPGGGIEDALALVLHFAGGAVGSISVAWTPDGHPHVHALDVLAREASIWLRLGPQTFDLGGLAGDTELAASYGDPMRRSAHRFLELVRAGDKEAVFCTPRDALATLAVGLACEQALLCGGTVTVAAAGVSDGLN